MDVGFISISFVRVFSFWTSLIVFPLEMKCNYLLNNVSMGHTVNQTSWRASILLNQHRVEIISLCLCESNQKNYHLFVGECLAAFWVFGIYVMSSFFLLSRNGMNKLKLLKELRVKFKVKNIVKCASNKT